jgi:hypothetical protein
MVTREDVVKFLKKQKNATKEEVLANFASWAVVKGVSIDKIGKLIMDMRSYPEWKWGT